MASLPPGSLFFFGAVLALLLRGRYLKAWLVVVPLASLAHLLLCMPDGHLVRSEMLGHELVPIRVDRLSLVWGYVFHLAALIASIYAIQVRDRAQHSAAMIYVGASIAAIFAGDLLTLFLYWEITAVSSVFLVWAGRSKDSLASGMRYVLMHVGSGVLVLSGAILLLVERGTLDFGAAGEWGMFQDVSSWGAVCLLVGFGIKAGFPLVHCWLADAYPKASVTGTVFLSAFTTKMAIYALARGFAGAEILLTVGAVMVVYPLLHALLADDLRQTLAHALHNQLGFMVVAIGVGSDLAINGVAAQAFAHILYKGLLFMSMGAVLEQFGTVHQSKLGGLAQRMPWTCGFCLVGALSVLPLNCGFVTKSLVLSSVAEAHHDWIWLVLMLGAVGAFLVTGIKVPYFAFFTARDEAPTEVQDAPLNMRIAMGMSASLCILIGVAPGWLYAILPTIGDYHPYTVSHIVNQLQLLAFVTLGFVVAVRYGFYPQPITGSMLDIDWFYRRLIPPVLRAVAPTLATFDRWDQLQSLGSSFNRWMTHQSSESGQFGRSVSTNAMAISAIVLLAAYLLIYY